MLLPPYRIEPLDVLYLFAKGVPESEWVNGIYPVEPDGTINLSLMPAARPVVPPTHQ